MTALDTGLLGSEVEDEVYIDIASHSHEFLQHNLTAIGKLRLRVDTAAKMG